ncbi:MAG TPA: class I SAM-dependent methyltransferase [Pyrinomonadaceae bacterium]|nr:class I SAM-dependent methyltransferase [Pyrinomonadaceae bacterium]
MKSRVLERAPISDPLCIDDSFVEDVERYLFAKEFVRGKRVVDIACGTGYGSYLMWKQGGARSVLGVDSSDEAIAIAERFSVPGIVDFCLGAAELIPIESSTVEVAISMETIEHLSDPLPLLKELRRTLGVGGMAIISTPLNNDGTRLKPENPYHLREYSSQEFSALVASVFNKVEMYTQLTKYQDDLWPESLESKQIVSNSRRYLRLITPAPLRQFIRGVVGSRGLHASRSHVVKGINEQGSVQIAVCSF